MATPNPNQPLEDRIAELAEQITKDEILVPCIQLLESLPTSSQLEKDTIRLAEYIWDLKEQLDNQISKETNDEFDSDVCRWYKPKKGIFQVGINLKYCATSSDTHLLSFDFPLHYANLTFSQLLELGLSQHVNPIDGMHQNEIDSDTLFYECLLKSIRVNKDAVKIKVNLGNNHWGKVDPNSSIRKFISNSGEDPQGINVEFTAAQLSNIQNEENRLTIESLIGGLLPLVNSLHDVKNVESAKRAYEQLWRFDYLIEYFLNQEFSLKYNYVSEQFKKAYKIQCPFFFVDWLYDTVSEGRGGVITTGITPTPNIYLDEQAFSLLKYVFSNELKKDALRHIKSGTLRVLVKNRDNKWVNINLSENVREHLLPYKGQGYAYDGVEMKITPKSKF